MKDIVVSVPHTGTRSLKDYLQIGHYEHFAPGRVDLLALDFHGHVPIRNPMHTTASWASREKPGDVLARMVGVYAFFFDWLQKRPESHYSLYRMEDLPVTRGAGDHAPGDHSERIATFQEVARAMVIAPHIDFWSRFYSAGELKSAAPADR